MSYAELKPHPDTVFKTFMDDSIGRNSQVISFAAFLNSAQGSIAIDGSWRSGKTFFVKQLQMVLEAFSIFHTGEYTDEQLDAVRKKADKYATSESNMEPVIPVYFDAWAYDGGEDPIMSLVLEIVEATGEAYNRRDADEKEIANAVIKAVAKTGASVLEHFTGINLEDAADAIDALNSDDPLEHIRSQRKRQQSVDEFLSAVCKERGNRLIIFVDELDRCRPTYAVKMLERIKHYFENEDVAFVFSINGMELQHAIRKFYGEQYDSSRYVDRFFDAVIPLVPVNDRLFEQYAFGGITGARLYHDVCDYLIARYDLTMREQIKFYGMTRIITQVADKTEYALQYSLYLFLPLISALRLVNRELYKEFVGGNNPAPFLEMMASCNYFDIEHMLLGRSINSIKNEEYPEDELRKVSEDMYNALFVRDYRKSDSCLVGQRLHFNEQTRKQFFEILSSIPENVK